MHPRSQIPLRYPPTLPLAAVGWLLSILLAFGLEMYSASWYFGQPIGAGAVVLLVVLLAYGLPGGISATVCVYGALALLGEATWLQSLPMLAYIAVSGLFLRKHPAHLMIITLMFWLFIGLPASYYLYGVETGYYDAFGCLYGLNKTLAVFLSALAADILVSYAPFLRRFSRGRERSGYAFNRIMLHLVLAATTIPFFIYILVSGYQEKQTAWNRAVESLEAQTAAANRALLAWQGENYHSLKRMSTIHLRKLHNDMQDAAGGSPSVRLVLTGADGRALNAVGMHPSLPGERYDWKAGGLVQDRGPAKLWLPDGRESYASESWRYSYLVRETASAGGATAVFLLPFAPFMEEAVQAFISYIHLLLMSIFVAMTLVMLLNRLFFRSLARLAETTIGIPDKISREIALVWPRSGISEIRLLTENFQAAADNMASILRQTQQANLQLSRQKDQLAQSERRLAQLAYLDHLTGLPNRLSMKERLGRELDAAEEAGWQISLSVLFIDLDRFKQINDTLGHIAGDELLCQVADRLRELESDTVFIARISGDEFVVVLRQADAEESVRASRQLIDQLASPFALHGQSLYITPSIGIASAPLHGRDIDTLMKNADSAMYAAKENGGKGYAVYSAQYNNRLSRKMWLENSLHQALLRHEFHLEYQIKIESASGRMTGMEALVRWKHPKRGLISPAEFIPSAEETGLIIPLGRWILRTACRQNVLWRQAGNPAGRMAVNLSARQFHDPRLVDTICEILDETGMEACDLELEITEGYLHRDEANSAYVLRRLRELGVFISIDDFGTGYSSLSQLKKYPIQAIKIDQSFIQGMDRDRSSDSIVQAIIQLAHSMSMKVVAEGVETAEEERLLRLYGCDELQGYRFGKPMDAAVLEPLLANMHAKEGERQ